LLYSSTYETDKNHSTHIPSRLCGQPRLIPDLGLGCRAIDRVQKLLALFCPPTPEAPAGRPHVIPLWAVFVDGKIYYDGSPETRHARNIESNSHVSLHLESGTEAIMLEGISAPAEKPSLELGKKLSQAYKKKYKDLGYAPDPHQWDEGGLYVFSPRQCITWTSFTENPTKFVFETE